MAEPESSQGTGVARHELVLGGQRSGKSACAEALAQQWLAQASAHRALLIATAQAGDPEMRERIERHKQDRALRLPALQTVEEPVALAQCLQRHGDAQCLILVDCLTLWLTNLMMPQDGAIPADPAQPIADLLEALTRLPGPVVLVSNEIGLGVVPMGAATREFVDALGRLNQALARQCARVTLMVAGLPLAVKGGA